MKATQLEVKQDRQDKYLAPYNGQQVFTRGYWLKNKAEVTRILQKYVRCTGESACIVEATYGNVKYDYSTGEYEYPREYTIRPVSQVVNIQSDRVMVVAWYVPDRAKYYEHETDESGMMKAVRKRRKRSEIEAETQTETDIKKEVSNEHE